MGVRFGLKNDVGPVGALNMYESTDCWRFFLGFSFFA